MDGLKDESSLLEEALDVGFPEGVSPLEALASIVGLARRLSGARRVTLIVPPEHAEGVVGEGSGEVTALGSGCSLCWGGELYDEVVGAEGAANLEPLVSEGTLTLPTASGGVVFSGWGGEVGSLLPLQLLAASAAATASWAAQGASAEGRLRAAEGLESELRAECAKLRELSEVDELTGLYNRRFFRRQLDHELHRHRRYGHPLSLALIDLDHFKAINDTRGHAVGDLALVRVAELALATMRTSDIVARIGGDEMAVLMPDTPRSGGVRAAERLCSAIGESPLEVEARPVAISLSIGVAGVEEAEGGGASALFDAADRALYKAKSLGRAQVAVGRPSLPP